MWRRHLLALVSIVVASTTALPAWACDGRATLSWTPPTQNTNGSPLTDLVSYRVYWAVGSDAGFPNSRTLDDPALTSYVLTGLPSFGTCRFAVTAINSLGRESDFSNVSTKEVGEPPGKPSLGVSWFVPTAPSASVLLETVEPNTQSVDEYYLTVVGSVRIDLGSTCIDWLRLDGNPGGGGGTVVPTVPTLGANNNDGVTARSFTVNTVTRARADFDCATFNGGTVTVQSVTKPLVKSGSTWRAEF